MLNFQLMSSLFMTQPVEVFQFCGGCRQVGNRGRQDRPLSFFYETAREMLFPPCGRHGPVEGHGRPGGRGRRGRLYPYYYVVFYVYCMLMFCCAEAVCFRCLCLCGKMSCLYFFPVYMFLTVMKSLRLSASVSFFYFVCLSHQSDSG